MKRTILIFTMLLAFLIPAVAQQHGKKSKEEIRKEMREFKMQFLAQEMELKGDQIQKFNALYSQMNDERWRLFRETKALEKKVKESRDASEADYKAATKALTQAKERDAAIEKAYDAKFAKFLTQKQIFKMKAAEEEFRERIRKMHRENRGKHRK